MEQSKLLTLTIKEVTSHFEAWRATRIKGKRIPDHLWCEAIALHPLQTASEIVQTLKLDYSSFKKKLSSIDQSLTPVDFIRIDQASNGIDPLTTHHHLENDSQATTIELEKNDGSRLRIQRELSNQAVLSIISDYFGSASCCN